MPSVTSTTASNQQSPNGVWPTVAPYIVPPLAASLSIVPVFRDLEAKSALQKGELVPYMSFKEGVRGGVKAIPTVGCMVGGQMVLQGIVEKALAESFNPGNLSSKLASAAVVGAVSAPVLAVFNGQTQRMTVFESLKKLSPRQALAITVQETAFVGGLSAADRLAASMRQWLGNNKAVDYTAAFVAGAAGSLVGHPANTALTRWQADKAVDNLRQLMWGSLRKARAVGVFSVIYKLVKEVLNSTVPASES